jgi:ketosteroid isomerase-like protein
MSEENVEIVRASVAAYARDDLDGVLKDFDPYVVIRPDANWPQNRPVLGGDAVRSFIGDLMATLGPGELASMEMIDAGEQVVTRFQANVHGQLSGVEGEIAFTNIHTFRRGKVVMLEYFLDHQEALEAAGLSE